MVKISIELSQEENLFLYSTKLESGIKSKSEVIKFIIGQAMMAEAAKEEVK